MGRRKGPEALDHGRVPWAPFEIAARSDSDISLNPLPLPLTFTSLPAINGQARQAWRRDCTVPISKIVSHQWPSEIDFRIGVSVYSCGADLQLFQLPHALVILLETLAHYKQRRECRI